MHHDLFRGVLKGCKQRGHRSWGCIFKQNTHLKGNITYAWSDCVSHFYDSKKLFCHLHGQGVDVSTLLTHSFTTLGNCCPICTIVQFVYNISFLILHRTPCSYTASPCLSNFLAYHHYVTIPMRLTPSYQHTYLSLVVCCVKSRSNIWG